MVNKNIPKGCRSVYCSMIDQNGIGRAIAVQHPNLSRFLEDCQITGGLGYLDTRRGRIPHFEDTQVGLIRHLGIMEKRVQSGVRAQIDYFTDYHLVELAKADSRLNHLYLDIDRLFGEDRKSGEVNQEIAALIEIRDAYKEAYLKISEMYDELASNINKMTDGMQNKAEKYSKLSKQIMRDAHKARPIRKLANLTRAMFRDYNIYLRK